MVLPFTRCFKTFTKNYETEDLGYELTFNTEICEFGVLEDRDLIPVAMFK